MDKKVYILGGAQTDFERNWTKEGKNMIALLKEAVEDGFKDGIAQGVTDGSRNTILQLTKRLLLKGQDDAFIKETLGVTDEDIRVAKQDLDC